MKRSMAKGKLVHGLAACMLSTGWNAPLLYGQVIPKDINNAVSYNQAVNDANDSPLEQFEFNITDSFTADVNLIPLEEGNVGVIQSSDALVKVIGGANILATLQLQFTVDTAVELKNVQFVDGLTAAITKGLMDFDAQSALLAETITLQETSLQIGENPTQGSAPATLGATTFRVNSGGDGATETSLICAAENVSKTIAGNWNLANDMISHVTLVTDVVHANSSLHLPGDISEEDTLNAAGKIEKLGAGTLELSGNNSFTGGVELKAGRLTLSHSNALGDVQSLLTAASVNTKVLELADGLTIVNPFHSGDADTVITAIDVKGTDSATMSGEISDDGKLQKTGTGTLTLSGDNSFTGGVELQAGRLKLSHSNALGSELSEFIAITDDAKVLELADGLAIVNPFHSGDADTIITAIDVKGTDSATMSGEISDDGKLQKTGTGTLTLSGDNSFTGGLELQAGTLKLSHSNALGDVHSVLTAASVNTKGLELADGLTIVNPVNTGNADSIVTSIDVTGSDSATLSGQISGSGSLIKDGGGTLTLSGANDFAGGLLYKQGSLTLSNRKALGSGAMTVEESAASISFSGVSGKIDNDMLFDSGANGTVTMSFPIISDLAELAGVISTAQDATIAITKMGNGELQLSGTNTFAGSVIFQSGYLTLKNAAALGNATLTTKPGGVVRLLSVGDGLNIANDLIVDATVIMDPPPNQSFTWSGAISSACPISVDGKGTLTLSGNNSAFNGGITVFGGTLVPTNNQALGTAAVTLNGDDDDDAVVLQLPEGLDISNAIAVPAAWKPSLSVLDGHTATISGVISGTGAPIKDGAGTLVLKGSNTFSGGLTYRAGALTLSNSAALGSNQLVIKNIDAHINFAGDITAVANDIRFDLPEVGTLEFVVASGLAVDLNGDISSADNAEFDVSVTKKGSGSLGLFGNNTFGASSITLEEGGLALGSSTALSLAELVITTEAEKHLLFPVDNVDIGNQITADADVTIEVFNQDNAITATISGDIGGAGKLTKTKADTLKLSGNNTFAGGFVLEEGGLILSSNTALGAGSFTVAEDTAITLEALIEISNAVSFKAASVPDAEAATITVADTATLKGALASAPGNANSTLLAFNKAGAGTLIIDHDNEGLGGELSLEAGVLELADATASLGQAKLVIQEGSTLAFAAGTAAPEVYEIATAIELNDTDDTTKSLLLKGDDQEYATVTASGLITGTGMLFVQGGADAAIPTGDEWLLKLTNAQNSYSGNTKVEAAQLEAITGALPGSKLTMTNDAIFRFGDAFVLNDITVEGVANDTIYLDPNGHNLVAPDFGDDIDEIAYNNNSEKNNYITFWSDPGIPHDSPNFINGYVENISLDPGTVLTFATGPNSPASLPNGFPTQSISGGIIEVASPDKDHPYELTINQGASISHSNLLIFGAAKIMVDTDIGTPGAEPVPGFTFLTMPSSILTLSVTDLHSVIVRTLVLTKSSKLLKEGQGKLDIISLATANIEDDVEIAVKDGVFASASVAASLEDVASPARIFNFDTGETEIGTLTVSGTGLLELGNSRAGTADTPYFSVATTQITGANGLPILDVSSDGADVFLDLGSVTITGAGQLEKIGTGTMLVADLTADVGSRIRLFAGTTSVTDPIVSSGDVFVYPTATLESGDITQVAGQIAVGGVLKSVSNVNVNGGTLFMGSSGSIEAAKVKIGAAATLTAGVDWAGPVVSMAGSQLLGSTPTSGTIDGDVDHSGTLATFGPLHITGNLTQTHTAITLVNVTPDTVGTITVGGTASLAGLLLIDSEGCAGPADMPKIPILLADGGISGGFVGTVFEPEECSSTFKLFQTSTGIFLINMAAIDFAKNACTCPQQCMLQALTDYYVEQTPGMMLDFIEDVIIPIQNPECCIWETLMGEAYADLLPMGIYSARLTTSSIQKQLWRAHDLWLQDNPGAHAWVDGAVQHWNQGGSNCVNGWRGTGASFDIGGDYRIGSNGLLGLAVNLQRSNGRVPPVDSKFNYSSYGATLYGSLYQNEAFYLDGQLGGSYTRSNVRRTVCLPNFTDCVESSLNGGRLQGRVEAGWVHKRASGGVQPFVAFEGEWARFGCFNEGCNSPVALSSWSSTSAHALFLGGGVRLFSVMEKNGWSLQPELDVAYAYNFTGSPYSTNISWVQAPSCCCFDGLNPVRNLVSLTAGAVAQIGQAWQIGLRFNGQVGTQHWNSLGGNLQVSYSF